MVRRSAFCILSILMLGAGAPRGSLGEEIPKADRWLSDHAAPLLNQEKAAQLYKSLIEGYSVPSSGLFLSFPRTTKLSLTQQASTYDQGVVGLALLQLGDKEKVGKILAFYEKAWTNTERNGGKHPVRGFANLYNAYFGIRGLEKSINVGPNAWIGLLAARYYRQTRDSKALNLAVQMARWMIRDVPHRNGAIAMGAVAWNDAPYPKIFSTENNISAYAFLTELAQSGGLRPWDRVQVEFERWRIARWLTTEAYRSKTKEVFRGFNPQGWDGVGALDSYTWYICALQPDALRANEIPVDHLMDVAANKFQVTVGGRKGVDTVDQTMAELTYQDAIDKQEPDPSLHRPSEDGHRLIWYEGQGQYMTTLQIMARDAAHRAFDEPEGAERDRLRALATQYLNTAQEYARAEDAVELKLPFGITYPCATRGRYYLFGGSAPPPINGHLADAVAPLAWRILAGMGFDALSGISVRPDESWVVKEQVQKASVPKPEILYNTSDDMTGQAWLYLNQKKYDLARRQALATIALWQKEAKKLQQKKAKQVGTYLQYRQTPADFQRITQYWALNDVAACYFILGKSSDAQGRYAEAKKYFETILKDYPLAQVWDKRGWFWAPVNAIKTDYIEVRRNLYGSLAPQIPSFPTPTK